MHIGGTFTHPSISLQDSTWQEEADRLVQDLPFSGVVFDVCMSALESICKVASKRAMSE